MTARLCAGRDGGGPRPMVPWAPAVGVLPPGEGGPSTVASVGLSDHDVVNAPIMF